MCDETDEKPNKVDKLRVDHGDYMRVGGGVLCPRCNFEYYDHPPVPGYRWLKRACNGALIKT